MVSLLNQFGVNSGDRVNNAIQALQNGRGVILIDDKDRENEGDLIFSAEKLAIDDIVSMIRYCSGIICVCITEEKARQLCLEPMVKTNTSLHQTAFTISIDAREGVSSGISAHDRWKTIQTAAAVNAVAADLSQPGHVFPLIGRKGGVLERRGHTEGSLDLVTMAGLRPVAVLCELMNDNGTLKNPQQLIDYALTNDLPMVSVEDLYQVRIVELGKGAE